MDSIPWDSSPSNHDVLGIFLELFPTTFYKQIYASFLRDDGRDEES